jgi:predicted TIM-barrel fold metal-dependent hydrolase
VERRTFVGATGAALFAAPSIGVIDTHIHLFDPARPQGVPWPPKDAPIYRTTLPSHFRQVTAGFGIAGAVAVECSPWVEDNQWLLEVAEKDPVMVGVVGNLEPGAAGFLPNLERFAKNKLFRGIRNGNLWGRDFRAGLDKPETVADLKDLAAAGLEMDAANPSPGLIAGIVRLSDRVPELRLVLDHMPRVELPNDGPVLAEYRRNLEDLARRPQVYVKVSGVLRRVDGRVPVDPAFYKPRLDELWALFGPDRLFYGSDWPNSELWGTYAQAWPIVRDYFMAKGPEAAEKVLRRNSQAAYRWVERKG